jgi:hypothetical protein
VSAVPSTREECLDSTMEMRAMKEEKTQVVEN